MDKQELVKRLERERGRYIDGSSTSRLLTDAIAYIIATPSRDEMLDVEAMCRAHHVVRSQQGFTAAAWGKLEERNREQYREAMRAALKSAPKEAPKMHMRHDANGKYDYLSPNTRGTVEDRRKSAFGNVIKASHVPRSYELGTGYGRRSNDRAHWTGGAPVVEERPELVPGIRKAIQWFKENEARDVAQPEKPGLVEWEYNSWTFYVGHWFENAAIHMNGWEIFQVSDNRDTMGGYKIYARRPLDARQGEK